MRSSLVHHSPAFITRNREHRVQIRARPTKEELRLVCDAEFIDAPLEALDGPCHGAAYTPNSVFGRFDVGGQNVKVRL